MASNISAILPIPSVPVFNVLTGQLDQAWYRFFLALLERSGGSAGVAGVPGGANLAVQYNANGAFGGLNATQLTALIRIFNADDSGAVPASGGVAGTYLNAGATFTIPATAGPAGGDLAGDYPDPTLAIVNADTGTFGSATEALVVTADAKGRILAIANVAIAIPAPLFGATAARPAAHTIGTTFFDTTLVIPIWWSGAHWVNASGATV